MQRNSSTGGAPVQLGKLFIGGLSFETTDEKLQKYFSQFGPVTSAVVMRDTLTKRSRGFGFVSFKDNESADKAMECTEHIINDRRVEAKRAVPREHIQPRHANSNSQSSSRPSTSDRTSRGSGKKIFVGGLHYDTSDATLRDYFANFGKVDQVQVMYNRETNKSRGFGFVTFESEETVEVVLREKRMHEIDSKSVEVKRAVPKSEAPPPRSASTASHHTGGYASSPLRRRPASGRPISEQSHDRSGYPSYASKVRRPAGKSNAPPLQNPWTARNHAQNFKQYNSHQHQQPHSPPHPHYGHPGYNHGQMALNMLPPTDPHVAPPVAPAPAPAAVSPKQTSESAENSASTPTSVAASEPEAAAEPPQTASAPAAPPAPKPETATPAASGGATEGTKQPSGPSDNSFDVDSYATLSPSAEGPSVESTQHLRNTRGPANDTRSPHGGGRAFSMFDFAARADADAGRSDPLLNVDNHAGMHLGPNVMPLPPRPEGNPLQHRQPAPPVGPKPMAHPQQPMLMHPAYGYPPHSYAPPHHLPYEQPYMPPRQPVGAPVEEDFASNFSHLNITPRMDPPPHMHHMMPGSYHRMGYSSRNFPHGQQPFGYESVPRELDQHSRRGYPYDAPGSYDMGYGGGVPHPPPFAYPPAQHRDPNAGPHT